MRKCVLSVIIIAAIAFASNTAFAGYWTDWSEHEIAAYDDFTVYFTPCMAGDHQINFINEASFYNGGTMTSAWADMSQTPYDWEVWAESDVMNYYRYQDLYAGSEDIGFRFVFYNIHNEPVTFYWRFYIDN